MLLLLLPCQSSSVRSLVKSQRDRYLKYVRVGGGGGGQVVWCNQQASKQAGRQCSQENNNSTNIIRFCELFCLLSLNYSSKNCMSCVLCTHIHHHPPPISYQVLITSVCLHTHLCSPLQEVLSSNSAGNWELEESPQGMNKTYESMYPL